MSRRDNRAAGQIVSTAKRMFPGCWFAWFTHTHQRPRFLRVNLCVCCSVSCWPPSGRSGGSLFFSSVNQLLAPRYWRSAAERSLRAGPQLTSRSGSQARVANRHRARPFAVPCARTAHQSTRDTYDRTGHRRLHFANAEPAIGLTADRASPHRPNRGIADQFCAPLSIGTLRKTLHRLVLIPSFAADPCQR